MTTHTLIQMEELPLEKTLKLSNFYTWGKAEGHREQVGKAGTQAPLSSPQPAFAGDPQSEGNSTHDTSEEQRIWTPHKVPQSLRAVPERWAPKKSSFENQRGLTCQRPRRLQGPEQIRVCLTLGPAQSSRWAPRLCAEEAPLLVPNFGLRGRPVTWHTFGVLLERSLPGQTGGQISVPALRLPSAGRHVSASGCPPPPGSELFTPPAAQAGLPSCRQMKSVDHLALWAIARWPKKPKFRKVGNMPCLRVRNGGLWRKLGTPELRLSGVNAVFLYLSVWVKSLEMGIFFKSEFLSWSDSSFTSRE